MGRFVGKKFFTSGWTRTQWTRVELSHRRITGRLPANQTLDPNEAAADSNDRLINKNCFCGSVSVCMMLDRGPFTNEMKSQGPTPQQPSTQLKGSYETCCYNSSSRRDDCRGFSYPCLLLQMHGQGYILLVRRRTLRLFLTSFAQ